MINWILCRLGCHDFGTLPPPHAYSPFTFEPTKCKHCPAQMKE